MEPEHILVTGATGFLGWNVLHALSGRYRLIGTWHARRYRHPGVRIVQLDVTDPIGIVSTLDRQRPDAVLHLAALTNVDQGEGQGDVLRAVNAEGTAHLAAACRDRGIRLVFASTDLVYGEGAGPHREDEPTSAQSLYARTKVDAERAIREVGGDWIICRTANLYGPSGPASRSFSDWLHESFRAGQELPLYEDQYRSFLYTEDAALALAEIVERAPSRSLFNLGGPERMTRVAFGGLFAEAFGYDRALIRPTALDSDGRGHLRGPDCSLDVSRLTALLARPPRPVREALMHWRSLHDRSKAGA